MIGRQRSSHRSTIFGAALFQSASGSMMTGELLPSSRLTFLRGARSRMPQPTGGEPVKVIMATSGWVTRRSATRPGAVTTFNQPGGSPQSSSNSPASSSAVNGVADAGFNTTGQPAAIAGATLCATRLSGKLKGLIAPTTPIGTRSTNPSLPTPGALASSGTVSPLSVRATAAENRNVSTARAASTRAVLIGLADSALIDRANSS